MYKKHLLIALGAAITLLVMVYIVFYKPFERTPSITHGLIAGATETDTIYGQRIQETYGHIVTLDDLKKDLAVDGYYVRGRFNMAFSKQKSLFGCDSFWTIVWDADAENRVIAIDGRGYKQCRP